VPHVRHFVNSSLLVDSSKFVSRRGENINIPFSEAITFNEINIKLKRKEKKSKEKKRKERKRKEKERKEKEKKKEKERKEKKRREEKI
jgi:methionine-rich copper-binding protein CopC